MKCQYQNEEKNCEAEIEEGEKLCYVHDPSVFPILFVQYSDHYSPHDLEISLSQQEAQEYITKGVAIWVDEQVRTEMIETMKERMSEALNFMVQKMKKDIADENVVEIAQFFTGSLKNGNKENIETFLSDKDFTEEERDYMKMFIEELEKYLKNNDV